MSVVLLGLMIPTATYVVVRVASAAYFHQKMLYHKALMTMCMQTEGVNINGIQAKDSGKGF